MNLLPKPLDRAILDPLWDSLTQGLEHSPLPTAVVSGPSHIVRYANASFCRLLDLPIEQIIGHALTGFIPHEDDCGRLLGRVFRSGQPEYHTERLQPNPYAMLWSYTMWPIGSERPAAGIIFQVTETAQFHGQTRAMNEALVLGSLQQYELREVSESANVRLLVEIEERKLAEGALVAAKTQLGVEAQKLAELAARFEGERDTSRESEQTLHTMADNISQLAWMADDTGWIFWYNKRWFDYTGTTLPEVEGWGWKQVHHPEYVEKVVEKLRRHFQNGEIWEDTFPLRGKDGKYRWFLSRAVPLKDEHGKLWRWFGTNTDVTDVRTAHDALSNALAQLGDKSLLLDALVQNRTAKLQETVAELEALSYSIAHDLRAPLRSMQAFSEILLAEHAAQMNADGRQFLLRIAKSAIRMDHLTRDVLNYSQVLRTNFELDPVNMQQLVLEVVDTYPMFAPKDTNIVLEGILPAVMGNEAMLTQVFSNLMSNAVKFVRVGEMPRIKIWADSAEGRSRFFVQDSGIGIPADQQGRIFGVFEQLDKTYEGTGIGLAIVKKSIERMGGTLGLESEPGRGTIFWFELQTA